MIKVEDKDTGAILYKKEPYEKRVDQLLERVSRLEEQVQILVKCVEELTRRSIHQ